MNTASASHSTSRWQATKRAVKFLKRVAVFVLVIAGLVAARRTVFGISNFEWRLQAGLLPFSTSSWLQRQSDRTRMLPDLFRQHRLIGMTKSEVGSLLGQFDYEELNQSWPYPGYDLGMRDPGNFGESDSQILALKFGETGTVIGFRSFYKAEGL